MIKIIKKRCLSARLLELVVCLRLVVDLSVLPGLVWTGQWQDCLALARKEFVSLSGSFEPFSCDLWEFCVTNVRCETETTKVKCVLRPEFFACLVTPAYQGLCHCSWVWTFGLIRHQPLFPLIGHFSAFFKLTFSCIGCLSCMHEEDVGFLRVVSSR